MSAPLFTRPDMVTVETGVPASSDPAVVDANLPASMLTNLRAVISGHAHYDHLLDVPRVMQRAPSAMLYGNRSAQNLLDAWAPDAAPGCDVSPPNDPIARSRVIAMDDPAASVVDYTNCPNERPAGAPLAGKWVTVPGSHVRVYAVCSQHPAQIGPMHYAPGDVDGEQCKPPTRMDAWKEGTTLAFLIDFLDPKTNLPKYRVYYQDAPTNAPIGHVPAPVLADKRVDLALLCVGSYEQVDNEPTGVISALAPRFALGGHWEDFFQAMSSTPQPLPFMDLGTWNTRAHAAMPASAEPSSLMRSGVAETERAIVANPGDAFDVP